jgi:hypothetical protein
MVVAVDAVAVVCGAVEEEIEIEVAIEVHEVIGVVVDICLVYNLKLKIIGGELVKKFNRNCNHNGLVRH